MPVFADASWTAILGPWPTCPPPPPAPAAFSEQTRLPAQQVFPCKSPPVLPLFLSPSHTVYQHNPRFRVQSPSRSDHFSAGHLNPWPPVKLPGLYHWPLYSFLITCSLSPERQVFKGHSYHLPSAHPVPSLQQTTLYSPPTPSPSLQGTGGQHPDTELEVFPSRGKDTNRGGGQQGGGSVLHSGSTQKNALARALPPGTFI